MPPELSRVHPFNASFYGTLRGLRQCNYHGPSTLISSIVSTAGVCGTNATECESTDKVSFSNDFSSCQLFLAWLR